MRCVGRHKTKTSVPMKTTIKYVLILTITLWCAPSFSQQHTYTIEDANAIHNSINQSRWDVGGRLSQYTFRYMSEFFPVAIINKSSTTYTFLSQPKESIDKLSIESDRETLSFQDYLKKLHISSFIVVHKGTIVYENYFSMLPEDQHTLQSITKVVTSTLITSLINSNRIDIKQPIEIYIPELQGSDWQGITVQEILDMRSGMDSKSIDIKSGPFTNPLHKNYQFESALGALPKAETTPESPFEFLKNLKKDKEPGLVAEYSNLNTFVLGWLAEKVTGKKYADLVSEIIWKPMGASSNAYVCLSNNGIPWSHGGMSATLRDLARFGMLYTNSEIKARNESLISFEQLQDIFDTPAIDFPIPFKWGYQWDLASNGILVKGGFGGQALYIDPEKEIVIAYFNYVDENWGINNIISDAALNAIIKAVSTN